MNSSLVNGISCIEFNRAYLLRIKKLGSTYYNKNSFLMDDDYLLWLYEENPLGKARLIVKKENTKWIGIIALIPARFNLNKKIIESYFAVNVLTHPEFRTKNSFIEMIEYIKKEVLSSNTCILGHPNRNALPGWKRKKMELREPLKLSLIMPKWDCSIKTYKIKKICGLNDIPNNIWATNSKKNTLLPDLNKSYYIWRYYNSPKKYNLFVIKKNSKVIGIKITKRIFPFINVVIDYVGNINLLPQSLIFPSLSLLPSFGGILDNKKIILPIKKEINFFATLPENLNIKNNQVDTSHITLLTSDF